MKKIAINLKEIKGKEINLNRLLDEIIESFDKLIKKDIYDEYRKNCSTIGKKIKVNRKEGIIEGTAKDILVDGRLVLESKGKEIILEEGDITIS